MRSRRETLSTGRAKPGPRHVEPSQFFKVLKREQGDPSAGEELNRLLQKLDEQGNRLVHSRTLVDLNHYKKLVNQILERTVGLGVGLTEKRSTDAHGRSRIYRCVEKINEELVALTDEVLKRENSRLLILEKVGQIKGMLIQLNA